MIIYMSFSVLQDDIYNFLYKYNVVSFHTHILVFIRNVLFDTCTCICGNVDNNDNMAQVTCSSQNLRVC